MDNFNSGKISASPAAMRMGQEAAFDTQSRKYYVLVEFCEVRSGGFGFVRHSTRLTVYQEKSSPKKNLVLKEAMLHSSALLYTTVLSVSWFVMCK